MQTLKPVIEESAFFRGLKPEQIDLITGCAANVSYQSGEFAARAGDPADHFWLIRQGRMALEVYVPGRGAIPVATMTDSDVVGFSWLLPPYQIHFDIHVLNPTRALLFDGRCLRGKCEQDPELGYAVLSRFGNVMAKRIEAMSLQLMDVYGEPVERRS